MKPLLCIATDMERRLMRDKYKAMIKQGKPHKVALTAIMRKLIELANHLVKADREWVKNGT
jgi:transposase